MSVYLGSKSLNLYSPDQTSKSQTARTPLKFSSHNSLASTSSSLRVYHLPYPKCETSSPTPTIHHRFSLHTQHHHTRWSSFPISIWISAGGVGWVTNSWNFFGDWCSCYGGGVDGGSNGFDVFVVVAATGDA